LKILIVAAANREIGDIVNKFEFVHQIDSNYKSYKLGNLNIDVLVSGYGSVFTAYFLTRALHMINYDLVINVGLAGSFDHFLEQGFIVNVVQDQFADLGIEHKNNFYSLFEEELMNENEFPFIEGKLNSMGNFEIEEVESLIPVKAVTVNAFHSDPKWINLMRQKYFPEIETMNGAAFFYVCASEKVPFLQIRAISHFVEIRRVENWNIPIAIKNLSTSIMSMLEELRVE
jgi:futalosine hydrolase